jgi:cyclic pyranopterin phosphate synthase
MPAENVQFMSRREILSFEEIECFVRVTAEMGVNKIRLTGGEPLVRHDLPVLVDKLARVAGIQDIALTTNGILLADQATALKEAGLKRLNISLDSLSSETFQRISRRDGIASDTLPAGLTFVSSADGCTASRWIASCVTHKPIPT